MSFIRHSLYPLAKAFFTIIGIAVGIFVVMIPFGMLSGAKSFFHRELYTYTVLPNSQFETPPLANTAPLILHINIKDVIGLQKVNEKKFRQILTGATQPHIKPRLKAVILDINTPGGTAVDSEAIFRMLLDFKKELKIPVYAHTEGLCASGGMFVACACDRVYSGPTNMIGSIGVKLGPIFNFYEAMQKIGVSQQTLTQGKDKDLFNSFDPVDKEKLATLKPIMKYDYERFVNTIVKYRKRVDKDKLIEVYGAHVFDPPKAKEIGYIDEVVSSYRVTLEALVKEAKIEGAYQVIKIKPHEPVTEVLQDVFSSKSKVVHSLDGYHPELAGRRLYLYE
ncbi:MAG: putative signal peptide peptidase SppA [Chlamydiia bacterium]|nr:putative signal peptide peptidase SppA [Chlamydiia bacterium]MCH9616481.1 putative signal peptide peptidase SppA [Chlamydiia bacterium]MCH9629533.1 putative signal peptide peptidase SppA [Chlamydiia bacterium]